MIDKTYAKAIRFNTEMVQAILDGRKTVTRRPIKENALGEWSDFDDWQRDMIAGCQGITCIPCGFESFMKDKSRYQIGDVLYVQEKFCVDYSRSIGDRYVQIDIPTTIYYCGNEKIEEVTDICISKTNSFKTRPKWKSSTQMTKEQARIWLHVIDVRIERLNEIKRDDCLKEGMTSLCAMVGDMDIALKEFQKLWDSIYGKTCEDGRYVDTYKSSNNPWVFVYEFDVIEGEVNKEMTEPGINKYTAPEKCEKCIHKVVCGNLHDNAAYGKDVSDCDNFREEAQKGEPFVCPFTNTEYEVTDKESEVQ